MNMPDKDWKVEIGDAIDESGVSVSVCKVFLRMARQRCWKVAKMRVHFEGLIIRGLEDILESETIVITKQVGELNIHR